MKSCAVIGGGIVGLAVAHRLLLSRPGFRLVLLEKEQGVGRHQSTHNSGVLHAGLYYQPGSAIVLHEDATAGIATVPLATTGEIVLVVGPEGGISPDELAQFEAAGALAVHLGPAVLRTSTAGGAAAAALSLRLGRWT